MEERWEVHWLVKMSRNGVLLKEWNRIELGVYGKTTAGQVMEERGGLGCTLLGKSATLNLESWSSWAFGVDFGQGWDALSQVCYPTP